MTASIFCAALVVAWASHNLATPPPVGPQPCARVRSVLLRQEDAEPSATADRDAVDGSVSAISCVDTDASAGKANAMYDTVGAVERPALWASFEGRDKLTAAFLLHGTIVSAANVAGAYSDSYSLYAIAAAAALGFSSAAWGIFDLATGRVADDDRPGFARERSIMLYTESYLPATLWLMLRFSSIYPIELTPFDPLLCTLSICIYAYGLAAPTYTALFLWEQLTSTEQLRMKGMIVSGAVGAVFVLEAAALLLNGGQRWWAHVVELYPAQQLLEPSVTLFAAYAVEAGMLIHRSARRGVITFATAVPLYGSVVLPLLTLVPMASLFWWKREEVSFWGFLFLGPGAS